jgi:hypothetical protein
MSHDAVSAFTLNLIQYYHIRYRDVRDPTDTSSTASVKKLTILMYRSQRHKQDFFMSFRS